MQCCVLMLDATDKSSRQEDFYKIMLNLLSSEVHYRVSTKDSYSYPVFCHSELRPAICPFGLNQLAN